MTVSVLNMKLAIFIALAVLGMFASKTMSREIPRVSMLERHEQWMAQYGIVYRDIEERKMRFKIFKDNVNFIERFNEAENRGYKLGINAFADQTNMEFKAARNGLKVPKKLVKVTPFKYENVSDVPSSMDWREQGAVTPIKDQGHCGSCWTFSAVAATEGINQLSTTKLISLSEQEIVDCDRTSNDQGCNGGFMEDAFEFISKNGGIATETTYPYLATDGTCDTNKESSHAASISGYEKVPANSEAALVKAVANQPVSVSIDASGSTFQFYSSGVFSGDCGTDLDHGVTAVGYGNTSDGTKYWLVKNSWGTSWGMDGYVMMEKDVSAEEGLCGIAMDSSYPIA